MKSDSGQSSAAGCLVINADDWGRDEMTTNCTLTCLHAGAISSVSAMVFMKDSERAAALAQELGIDTGLHLNLTSPFTTPCVPSSLAEHQSRVASFLQRRRWMPVLFHPGLIGSFQYLVEAQLDEFRRSYGHDPQRI